MNIKKSMFIMRNACMNTILEGLDIIADFTDRMREKAYDKIWAFAPRFEDDIWKLKQVGYSEHDAMDLIWKIEIVETKDVKAI